MATKTLNDYSALGGLFRDGTLGVLISTGVLGTLVPNGIESIGKTQNLSSFKTLNLFSVVYFLLPIIIFTTYWHARGSRLFISEKLSKMEANDLPYTTEYNWIKTIITFCKLLPIALFIYDNQFFSGWPAGLMLFSLGGWYIGLAIWQQALCTSINQIWLHPMADLSRKDNFIYHSYCTNALIHFLDILIGLTLIVFSKPWILYSSYFYFFASFSLVFFAMASWAYSVSQFKSARLKIEDYLVAVLLVSSGLLFPAINLSYHWLIILLTLSSFLIITIWWLLSDKGVIHNEATGKTVKVIVPAFFILISASLLHYAFFIGFGSLNTSYLKYRYLASQQITEKEVFPFSDVKNDYAAIDKENFVLPTYLGIKELKDELQFADCLRTSNLRMTYYREYYNEEQEFKKKNKISKFKIESVIKGFSSINNFYLSVFDAVEKIPLQSFKKKLEKSGQTNLEVYLHPVDYTAYRLSKLKGQSLAADSMIHLTEGLYRLSLLEKNKQNSVQGIISINNNTAQLMISRLDGLYKESVQLRYDKSEIRVPLDSSQLIKVVKFHKLYYELMEIEYIKAYEAAQKVYRSYLVDSQRIGIWTFLTAVLTLGLASYFNNKANRLLSPTAEEDQQNKKEWPLDTPKNALLIQTIAIIILLVPLLKPIEPQNIDPEKPYWMVSLQNWHTPSFVKALNDKDQESHRYVSSRPIINNQIHLTELQEGLKAIGYGIQDGNKKIDDVIRNIEIYRIQAQNDANQIDRK